jgi:hypothetical protein
MTTLHEAARRAMEALAHHLNQGRPCVEQEAHDALRAALAASEEPATLLTDYELTEMAIRASQHGGGLHPWWMVLCREVEKRVRQECALDKLAAESQRLGLYDAPREPEGGA